MEAYLYEVSSLVGTLPAGGIGCTARFLGACSAIGRRLTTLSSQLASADKAAQLKGLLR